MSKERDILKSLLLKEELEILDKLEKKILSEDQFTQEVSQILVGAIQRSQLKDKSFEKVLSKPIKKGMTKAFSENQQSIIDSMLPIMGQLIRKTVTNSIKQFVSDINRTLELKLSFKSIKWRWQAKKAGITYAEMIFKKTISYKVQELFVIHRKSGILIHHVGDNATLLDNNAISGMLTVIQDFISDSIKTSDNDLFSATIGEAGYLIAQGPKAYLATVVKGDTSERLKQKSQELIENIHSDFSSLLSDESRYQNDEDFEEYLSNHLISKSISTKQKKVNWVPWLVIIMLLVFGIYYWSNYRYQQRQNIIKIAQSTHGFVLQNVERDNEQFIVSGLLDPMADTSQLKIPSIVLKTQPFISLDQEIIQKRVSLVSEKFNDITIETTNNSATVSGSLNYDYSVELLQQLNNVIGIDTVINQLSIDNSQSIDIFIRNHKEIHQLLNYNLKNKLLTIEGVIKQNIYHTFVNGFKASFPDTTINDENIMFIETINTTIQNINSTKINIPKIKIGNSKETHKLTNIIQKIQYLLKYKNIMQFTIVGESDCYGLKSDEFSLQRATFIKDLLVKNNINENSLSTNIKPCVIFSRLDNNNVKNVSFIVQ